MSMFATAGLLGAQAVITMEGTLDDTCRAGRTPPVH